MGGGQCGSQCWRLECDGLQDRDWDPKTTETTGFQCLSWPHQQPTQYTHICNEWQCHGNQQHGISSASSIEIKFKTLYIIVIYQLRAKICNQPIEGTTLSSVNVEVNLICCWTWTWHIFSRLCLFHHFTY